MGNVGNIQKRRWLPLIFGALGLCALLAGCAHEFGLKSRKSASPPESLASAPMPEGSGNPMVMSVGQVSYQEDGGSGKGTSAPKPIIPATLTAGTAAGPEAAPMPAETVPTPPSSQPPVAAATTPKNVDPPAPVQSASIALHYDDQDVRKVFEMMSRDAKVNIVVSPGVSGKVTLNVQNKTLDDALAIIARLCHLTIRRENNVIFVLSANEAKKIEEENLPVRIYRLNYVKAGDMKKILEPFLNKGKCTVSQTPDSEVGLPSDVQEVNDTGSSGNTKGVSTGGNSLCSRDVLIVQGPEEILQQIDRLVTQIDVQPVQVVIEAVIVKVSLNKNSEFGASIAILDDSRKVATVLGSGSAINGAAGVSPASIITNSGALTSGMATSTYGLTFGFVGNKITGYLKALEGYGQTNVLASPRIFVLNKQRAEIHVGENIGYQDQTTTQTSTSAETKFLKTGTQLRVRPFVASDGNIRMEVRPERSSGYLNDSGIPQVSVAETTTNIMVPDGQTVVIGGMLDEEVTKNWEGLPILSRLPWIGYLFRHTTEKKTKVEFIVILTPHICPVPQATAVNSLGEPHTLGVGNIIRRAPALDGCKGESESLFNMIASPPDKESFCPVEAGRGAP
jgi:general secretion pathway protein D